MHVKRTVADDLAGTEEELLITVKNTFITVSLPVASRLLRRSTSLPTLARSADNLEVKPHHINHLGNVGVVPAGNPAGELFEINSSEGFCTDTEDDRAFVPSAESREAARVTEEHGRAWEPAGAQTPVQMQQNWPAPVAPQLAPPIADPLGQFQQEVAGTVMAVKSSLECSGFGVCVDLTEHRQGWLITVKVLSHDMHQAEYMITVAKEILLMSTEESPTVKVMGYQLVPFFPSPQGFLALLGAVPDQSQACYDAYGKGFCHRGAACCWQHPPCMRSVTVAIVCNNSR